MLFRTYLYYRFVKNEEQMPNCKYFVPKLFNAPHTKELETLASVARTLS